MTRQEATEVLEILESRISGNKAKGYQLDGEDVTAAVLLKRAIEDGVYGKKEYVSDILGGALTDPKPKKRGRPKGSKNRKKA